MVETHLMQKAVAIRVAKLASLVSTIRLDRDINGTD